MKILIIKPSALGDVVQALPVAAALKRRWPGASIDWVLNESYQELLEGHPALRRVVLYPRQRWKSLRSLPEVVRWGRALRAERYDLAIDLQGLLRSGLMIWASGAARKVGLASAREGAWLFYNETVDDGVSAAAARYLKVLDLLNVPHDPLEFGLKAVVPVPEAIAHKPYTVLHPYARWRTKLWPWRFYQELVDRMPDRHFVVAGEGPWFPLSGPGVTDVRGKLRLPQLVSVLAGAQAVLSTDSGPAHLAAALGAPTLVLFGATDPAKTAPVGKQVRVLQNKIFCVPCLKRRCLRRDVPMECLAKLLPETVVRNLEEWVASSP